MATSWEAFFEADTPNVQKIALRSAVVMSPDRGGIFDMLLRLVRSGPGGRRATVNNSFRGSMTPISNLLSNS